MEPAVAMGPPLSLELTSSSLGPFKLGATVFTVLDYLRTSGKALFPWVQIKYDPTSPATSPIHIHLLPLPGILLIFPSPSQRLTQIHILALPSPNLTLLYSTLVFASPTKPLTRGDVGRVFGPTFDGGGSQEIWFPGLGFGCDESSSSKGRNQRVRRIHVCQKEEMGLSVEVVKPRLEKDELVKAVIQTSQRSLQLHFSSSPLLSVVINETTVSDLLAELGPPTRTFIKEDFRMDVHREASSSGEVGAATQGSYFVNYVQYGIDFLIAPRTHRVIKIITHSNLPGAIQFGRYERCPWEFEGDETTDPPSPPLSVTTKASLLFAALSTTFASDPPSPSSTDWSNNVFRTLTANASVPPTLLPLPSSPSPSPSPPPVSSSSEKKKNKHSKREQQTASVDLPQPSPVVAATPVRLTPAASSSVEAMKGMVLDRAGEGWGRGVILESTRLVAVTEHLAFEVLGEIGDGGGGGDVETVMMF